MGRYLTEVRRVAWLLEPVPTGGRPGLFTATVPKAVLPAGWVDGDQLTGGTKGELAGE